MRQEKRGKHGAREPMAREISAGRLTRLLANLVMYRYRKVIPGFLT